MLSPCAGAAAEVLARLAGPGSKAWADERFLAISGDGCVAVWSWLVEGGLETEVNWIVYEL